MYGTDPCRTDWRIVHSRVGNALFNDCGSRLLNCNRILAGAVCEEVCNQEERIHLSLSGYLRKSMDRLSGNDMSNGSGYHSEADASVVDSLAESGGSVQTENITSEPVRRSLRKRKMQGGTTGSQFMQCCVEMRNVPVQDAWAYFRDHRIMANQIPGILEGFDYVEGDGEAGSMYVASYTPKHSKPGEDNYVMQKIEVRDEMARLQAVSCVAGKYSQRYKLYLSFFKVLPHEVFGDRSCVVIWRLEYELRDLNCAPPKDSMAAHKFAMELFRDMYNRSSQVHRPIYDHSDVSSDARTVVRPCRLRRKRDSIANAKLGVGVSVWLRSKKSKVERLTTTDESLDRQCEKKHWRGRKQSEKRQRARARLEFEGENSCC